MKRDLERERIVAQERLILAATEAISAELQRTGIRRADLAKKLDVSKAHITQALTGDRNLTLKSLADFAWGLDCDVQLFLAPREFNESRPILRSLVDLKARPAQPIETPRIEDVRTSGPYAA